MSIVLSNEMVKQLSDPKALLDALPAQLRALPETLCKFCSIQGTGCCPVDHGEPYNAEGSTVKVGLCDNYSARLDDATAQRFLDLKAA